MNLTLKKKIEHFRDLLVNGENFGTTMNYFLDEIASDRAFLTESKKLNNVRTISILLAAAERLNQLAGGTPEQEATPMFLSYNKKFKFAHGTCTIANNVVATAYLVDLDKGVGLIPSPTQPSLAHFARFTARSVELPEESFIVPDRSGYSH